MKKIKVCSSVEDFDRISKEYDDARSRRKDQQAIRDKQNREYNLKSKEASDIVVDNISSIIQEATDDEFMKDIYVDADIRSYDDNVTGKIKVEYGTPGRNDNTVPLSWDWQFELDYGKKQRKTSSWSGLTAATQEDIDVLKKSVSTLEALASVTDDYIEDLISKNALNYYDYVSQEVDDPVDSISYIIRKLEALAGTGRYILIYDPPSFNDFLTIDGDTGKQFKTTTLRVKKPFRTYHYNYDSEYEDTLSIKYVIEEKRYSKEKLAQMIYGKFGDSDFTVYTEDDIDSLMKEYDEQYLANKEED